MFFLLQLTLIFFVFLFTVYICHLLNKLVMSHTVQDIKSKVDVYSLLEKSLFVLKVMKKYK